MRIAQMAALALGVSAAALWALQVPGIQGNLPEKPPVQPVALPDQTAARAGQDPALDPEQVAAAAVRLELGANIKKPEATPAKQAEPTVTASAPAEWKYLAPIKERSRMLAVVSRNGKQKIMSPGREWDGAKLLAVDEQKITIEDANGRHDILRGEREGSAINWTKLTPQPAVAGNANMSAIERQIQARGIDGAQASRFREEMRRRRRAEAVGLSPEAMRALGVTETQVRSMSGDQVEALSEQYQSMTAGEVAEDGSMAVPPPPTDPDAAAAGAPN